MYNFPYAPPYPWMMPRTGLTLDEIKEAQKALKDLEKSLKDDDDKDKKKKEKIPKFTLLETIGLLLLTAPFIGSAYVYLLGYMIQNMNSILNNFTNVPH